MSCEYQHLYLGNDGYVVRCKECGKFQLAYQCICISLNEDDYNVFCKIVAKRSAASSDSNFPSNSKSYCIKTPDKNISFLFTRMELLRLNEILEMAGAEMTALSMIELFNVP